jgi:anti-sigma factor ChrR (cupin superfamily)
MTHPDELLAGYVDGTLTDDERAVVDAHLATCSTCREEVELARSAVAALERIEEAPVPFGVTGPVLAEAGRTFERRAAVWQRFQWAAGVAAAAALVVVVALNVGGDGEERVVPAAADAAGEAPRESAILASVELELQSEVNYTNDGVESLARHAAARAEAQDDAGPVTEEDAGAADATGPTGVTGEAAPTPTGATAAGGTDAVTTSGAGGAVKTVPPDEAIGCLRRAEAPLDDARDTLVRLIEAEYEGTPAYLAVFLESPAAGEPPSTAVVYVVATSDCQFLSGAALPL